MVLKHTSERGVSMMEMMIVVVIVGLLSALAVPNFGGAIKKMKFDNTGREIVSTMRYARAAAVGQQRPLGVFIDNDAKVMITFIDLVSPELGTYETGDSVVRRDSLTSNVNYIGSSFANSTVIFNPDGTASQSGDVVCSGYSSGQTRSFSVSLVAGSGRAKLLSYN